MLCNKSTQHEMPHAYLANIVLMQVSQQMNDGSPHRMYLVQGELSKALNKYH